MQFLVPLLLVVVSLAASVVATRTDRGAHRTRDVQNYTVAGWNLSR